MPTPHSPPRAFLSYSHDNPAHSRRVLGLATSLRRDGIDAEIDRYVNGTPERGWPSWMLDQLDWADFVLVICTENYYRRFRGQAAPGIGNGASFESMLITQELYDVRGKTTRFVPVLFDANDVAYIPDPIRGSTRYVLGPADAYKNLVAFLIGRAGIEKEPLGEIYDLPRPSGEPLDLMTDGSPKRGEIGALPERLRADSGNDAKGPKMGLRVTLGAVGAAAVLLVGVALAIKPVTFASGNYKCSLPDSRVLKCSVEIDAEGPTLMFDAGDENRVDRFRGRATVAPGDCVVVPLSREFGTTSKKTMQSSAGSLSLCASKGTWRGTWTDEGIQQKFEMRPQ